MKKECKIKEHRDKYLYTCKECYFDEKDRTEPYERIKQDGSIGDKFDMPVWCHCPVKCKHNTYTCTICWLPVAHNLDGTYYFVDSSPQPNK